VQRFVSRPDLEPPSLRLSRSGPGEGRSYFLAPGPGQGKGQGGRMICDDNGELVWFAPDAGGRRSMDFRPQMYQGQPVLTWWEGTITAGVGEGRCVIADRSYRHLHAVQATGGPQADLHEFHLTPHGTALITAYRTVPADLSRLGGPARGFVLAGLAQEIDVATGRLLFQWDSLDHVPLTETQAALQGGGTRVRPFDYFHINSIAPMPDGSLLISARNTCTVYRVARPAGTVIWRLGGRNSSFAMGPGTRFYWQHDARPHGPQDLTLFDDGAAPAKERQSRALQLHLDTAAMRATLTRAYRHPKLLAIAMGNMQVLPGGGVFVGWGMEPYFSEFSASGRLLVDGHFPGGNQSYRAFTQAWTAQPASRPDVAARADRAGTTVYASWNGASTVRAWQVLAGARPDRLRPVAVARRSGFETSTRVSHATWLAVAALGADGAELARSAAVTPR
jgi:hypothetical protein